MKNPLALAYISTEDLQRELDRRKNSVPVKVENPDFTDVITLSQGYINDILWQGFPGDDMRNHVLVKNRIVEAVIQAVFGSNVWDWISERKDMPTRNIP